MTSERDAARRDLRASTRKLARLEHETRRRELENDRLKARLSAVVESAGGTTRGSRDIEKGCVSGVALASRRGFPGVEGKEKGGAEALRAGVSGPGPSPAVSLALHHSMMAAYEAKLRAFMHDANDLRAMLRDREGVDAETRGASSSAAKPERRLAPHREAPANGAARLLGSERDADADADARADEDPERALDAFAFNLASLRDRLGDADAEERDANGCPDARTRAAAAAAPPPRPPRRWGSRCGGTSASTRVCLRWTASAPLPPRGRRRGRRADRGFPDRTLPSASPGIASRPTTNRFGPGPLSPRRPRRRRRFFRGRPRPGVASPASPEVSSSEPDDDDAGGRLGALGVRGAFAAARGDGSSSEEVFEEVFDPPARANKPEPERLLPRREKAAARLRRALPPTRRAGDAPAGDAPAGDAPRQRRARRRRARRRVCARVPRVPSGRAAGEAPGRLAGPPRARRGTGASGWRTTPTRRPFATAAE